jgi:hypothetical protein
VEVNLPQALLGAQLQVTPLFAESFKTVAAIAAVAPVCSDVGGAVLKETEIGGAVTLTVAVAVLVLSETEVAVMVTVPPCGAFAGAV